MLKILSEVFSFMKKYNTSKNGLLKGKGFILTVTACVAVVAAAGVITYRETAKSLENQLNVIPKTTEVTPKIPSYDEIKDANKNKTDVKKETEQTTTEPQQATEIKISTAPTVRQKFCYPLAKEVINEYSGGELVKSKTLNCWKTHDGVDIKAELGDPVSAMTSGKVTKVYEDALWGVCVIIDHENGIEGHYYGLAKNVNVKPDQKVASGEIIGAVGNTAECELAEDCHLHFGVKQNGEWISPIPFIRANM